MASHKKLSKQELKREPAFNVWLRGVQHRIEEAGPTLIKPVIGIALALVVIGGIYLFYNYNYTKAEVAFAKALDVFNAEVKDPKDLPTTPTFKRYYTNEQQKYQEALAAFEQAAGYSSQREKSRYYAALCRLKLDPPKGQQELKALADGEGQVSQMARYALAGSYVSTGQIDTAIETYSQLKGIIEKNKGIGAVISPGSIQLTLGNLYELQGKVPEATKAYLEVIKINPRSRMAQDAFVRLMVLDPENARKMPIPKAQDDDTV